jgi:hypothetical protein
VFDAALASLSDLWNLMPRTIERIASLQASAATGGKQVK